MQKKSKWAEIGIALGIAAIIIVGELFFRHYVALWAPALGSRDVNDSLALLIVYGGLMAAGFGLMHLKWGKELAGTGNALVKLISKWQGVGWLLAGVLAIALLPIVDNYLWGSVSLPIGASTYENPTLLLSSQAGLLIVLSHILINGLFFPVAEEFLWRGVVQARLLRAMPVWLAVGLTAVLFSLKYALVYASLGQLLAMTTFGVICGIVAARRNWRHSAALNLFASLSTILISLILRNYL